jgi:hypothetical protein
MPTGTETMRLAAQKKKRPTRSFEAEAAPHSQALAVVQDVSGDHQSFGRHVYDANNPQYLAELCTLLVEEALGPFFAVGRLTTPVPVHLLTNSSTAHLLYARHIWPAGNDAARSEMSTSPSPNPTRSCGLDTGPAHLPPYLFGSTNILRSQPPDGLRPHQEWKNYSSR